MDGKVLAGGLGAAAGLLLGCAGTVPLWFVIDALPKRPGPDDTNNHFLLFVVLALALPFIGALLGTVGAAVAAGRMGGRRVRPRDAASQIDPPATQT